MFADVITVLWKEVRESFLQRPNMRGGWVGLLVTLGVFGIFLPLQAGGPNWIESPLNLLLWAWVPYLLVSGIVADSIAGERERHTLETLLASRLSDRAILFGKIAASMVYGWGLTIFSVLLSVITINVAYWEGSIIFFSLPLFASILGLSFLVSLLSAALGVLFSLRAATVRQAQQTFNLIFLLMFIPIFVFPRLPQEIQAWALETVSRASASSLALSAAALLLVINLALIALAMRRFQRARLILD
jgi:ABC-2 type transport system permease protein